MTYNIFSGTAPAMPKPSKGTEFIKFALSQASKDMREVLIPMAMPALAAHLTEVKFMYSDNKYYEMCGQMGHLIGPSGIGKAQLGHLMEAIMRPFRQHDEVEFKKLVDWQRQMNGKFHHTPLHQEGARPPLLPPQQPTHGCKAPHGVAHPLPAPAHSPTVRWLPQVCLVVRPTRSTPHYRTPGRPVKGK